MEASLKTDTCILTITKEAIVVICDSMGRSVILGYIPVVVAMTAKLPISLQLMKVIPSFTPARAITYTNTKFRPLLFPTQSQHYTDTSSEHHISSLRSHFWV